MSDCPVLQNTCCGSIGIMPQKGHECDQSPGIRVTFRSRPYPIAARNRPVRLAFCRKHHGHFQKVFFTENIYAIFLFFIKNT